MRIDSNKFEKHDCEIEIISPVYIGSGLSYGPHEFIDSKSKNILQRADLIKYYSSLPLKKYKNEFINKYQEENFVLSDFNKLINTQIKNDFQNDESKLINLKNFVRYKAFNKSKVETNDVYEHVKTLDSLYIPGSSLKGAITTALLYDYLDENIINRYINSGKFDGDKLNDDLRSYFSHDKDNTIQSSVMKYFIVSDSATVDNPSIFKVINILLKKDNNGKLTVKDSVNNYLETIYFSNNSKKRLSTCFSFQYNEELIDNFDQILDMEHIKNSVYSFSCDLINHEIEIAEKYNVDYLKEFYETIKVKNKPQCPVLRIGGGSGLLSTTVDLKILKFQDKPLKRYLDIDAQKLDNEFPKSRRLALFDDDLIERQPLGWTCLHFD